MNILKVMLEKQLSTMNNKSIELEYYWILILEIAYHDTDDVFFA